MYIIYFQYQQSCFLFRTQYFESDDPDLYTAKVQYIREHDVSDLELVFAEEEFTDDGSTRVSTSTGHWGATTLLLQRETDMHGWLYAQVVPLVDHGEKMNVTERNKLQYLNLLAQYRLARQTKAETEHFLKGHVT